MLHPTIFVATLLAATAGAALAQSGPPFDPVKRAEWLAKMEDAVANAPCSDVAIMIGDLKRQRERALVELEGNPLRPVYERFLGVVIADLTFAATARGCSL